jgi:FtsP/CotA-like multicopper oxidase with cupredoxin domain
MQRSAVFLVCCALLLAVLLCVKESNAASLTQPTVISSASATWSATLSVGIARVVTEQVSFTSRVFCYNGACSYPGPTIVVKPGDEFTLTLVNTLTGSEPDNMSLMNTIHYPNTTNVHTVWVLTVIRLCFVCRS